MRLAWLLGFLAMGCVPAQTVVSPAISPRWVPVEAAASRLDYPAGDGAVDDAARVLVLFPAPSASRGRRPPPEILLPGRVDVGEIFRVGIRVPRADERDVRTFRLRCGRPGLRLLDGDRVAVTGRRVTERRAIAESAGPARFDLEEIDD